MNEECVTAVLRKPPKRACGFVYLLKGDGGYYKIGKSKKPKDRHKSFSTLPYDIRLIHQIATNDARWLEKTLHDMFAECRVIGEWFLLEQADVDGLLAWTRYDRPTVSLPIIRLPGQSAVKQREGHHNFLVQIPDVLWDRLCADADAAGTSAARVLSAILAKHYRVKTNDLPKPKRAGRKPKR